MIQQLNRMEETCVRNRNTLEVFKPRQSIRMSIRKKLAIVLLRHTALINAGAPELAVKGNQTSYDSLSGGQLRNLESIGASHKLMRVETVPLYGAYHSQTTPSQ